VIQRVVLATILLAGCSNTGAGALGAGGDIEVPRGFAFAPTSNAPMAAYFTAVNGGRTPDTLVAVVSSRASSATVHRQRLENGMMHMDATGPLVIAPGDSLVLAPGGLHVMLELSGAEPTQGDSLQVTLRFARAGDVLVTLPVRAYGDES
jgi:copper(I)-binding protein